MRWHEFWKWVRFGKLHEYLVSIDGGVVSEVAIYGRGGKLVGYWAYGHWDPELPYRGE